CEHCRTGWSRSCWRGFCWDSPSLSRDRASDLKRGEGVQSYRASLLDNIQHGAAGRSGPGAPGRPSPMSDTTRAPARQAPLNRRGSKRENDLGVLPPERGTHGRAVTEDGTAQERARSQGGTTWDSFAGCSARPRAQGRDRTPGTGSATTPGVLALGEAVAS